MVKKKHGNKGSSVSLPGAQVIASGISFQHVPKEKLSKTKIKSKKDATEDDTQNNSSRRSKKHKNGNKAVENEFGSEIEQSIGLLDLNNVEKINVPTMYESSYANVSDNTIGTISQEHDTDDTHEEKNGSSNVIFKKKHVFNKNSDLSDKIDESKNWREKKDNDHVRSRSMQDHNYQSSNPSTSQNKEIHKEIDYQSYKFSNKIKNKSNSNDKHRSQHYATRNWSDSNEDDLLQKSNKAYTKDKYDESQNTRFNKKRGNYNDELKVPTKSLQSSHVQTLENNVDDKKFHLWLKQNKNQFNCVTETEGNLFDASDNSCLAHCVAEDMSMGSGIAVSFRKIFKNVGELLDQRQRAGGLAILEDKNRFIYYLVTKKYSKGKPTLSTLWSSLNKLKNHMVENNAKALSIPRIGCGLDRLEWCEVKPMIEYLFSETDINVTVYNLPKQGGLEDSSPKQVIRNCKVVPVNYSLNKIEEFTIIVYLCSEEGEETEQIKTLDKKFNILSSYNKSTKRLGSVIRYEKRNYILYGFVVKTKPNNNIDFKSFEKCIYELNSQNKKDGFEYVAIEEFSDSKDDLIFNKIINLMQNGLKYVQIYVCQPHMEN